MQNDESDKRIDSADIAEEIELSAEQQPMSTDDEADDSGEDMAINQDESDEMIEFPDDSVQGFFGHGQEPVYTIDMHPQDNAIICSGGGDDKAYLWRVDTGETLATLEGHTDSCVSVGFSADGKYVATGGMDGQVRVYRLPADLSEAPVLEQALTGPDEVVWIKWHPKGHVLVAGSNDGTVWMWFIPNGGQVMNVFTGHSAAVTCGQFSPDGKHLVTGDSDGTLIMWDPKVPTPAWRLSSSVGDARWHQSGALTCLSVSADGQLILTGGEDGACKLIQLQSGKFIGSLNGHSDAVEAVAFCPSLPLVVSGSIDGMVLVWDLQTLKQRTALQHQDGVTNLQFIHNNHQLITGGMDRVIRVWDVRTGECLKQFTGHQEMILDFAVNNDGRFLVSAGDDGVCLVFSITSTTEM